MAKALTGGVLRGFKDGRSVLARQYATLYKSKLDELGAIPGSIRPLIREWARIVMELDRIAAELEKPGVQRQALLARRLRREQRGHRFFLLKIDYQISRFSGRHSLAEALSGIKDEAHG